KSQLAIQYAAQIFHQQPKWIFWLRASSRDWFIQSCTNTARRLRIPGVDDPSLNVNQLFMDWLHDKKNGSWLLILDNCDDAEVFSHATQPNLSITLPQAPHGKVLLTSRNQAAALSVTVGIACIIDVGAMHVDEALEMFHRKLPNDRSPETDRISLAIELGCLPLAMVQATAYMSNNRMNISKYLARNENHQKKLLLSGLNDRNRDPDLKNSIILTWQLSFDQIQAQYPKAAELLSLMSVFDRQSIPRELLIEKEEDELDFEEALATLANFSLVNTEIGQENIASMHRLVQLTAHLWLQQHAKLATFQSMAITRLCEALPESYLWEDDTEYSLLYPHALAIFRYDVHNLSSTSQLQYSLILCKVGTYDRAMARYDVAHERLELALFFLKLHCGPEDFRTLFAIDQLALVLTNQGKPFEAERMCVDVLETRERIYGPHDLVIADSCDHIGSILASRKSYSKAEKYLRRALYIREKQLNAGSQAVLGSVNNLASVLAQKNENEEAAKLHHQALDGLTKLFGPNHPDSLSAMNNYASDL
ncbi:MAG: hypothetical protein Q9214_006856, partial [Letrouitia sp. 1 TL-2023]